MDKFNKRIKYLSEFVEYLKLDLSKYEDRRKLKNIIYLLQEKKRQTKGRFKDYRFTLQASGVYSGELNNDMHQLRQIRKKGLPSSREGKIAPVFRRKG